MKKILPLILVVCMLLTAVACSSSNSTKSENTAAVTDAAASTTPTKVPEAPATELINEASAMFEAQTGIKIEIVTAGTGELLKRVEAEQSSPLGDVL